MRLAITLALAILGLTLAWPAGPVHAADQAPAGRTDAGKIDEQEDLSAAGTRAQTGPGRRKKTPPPTPSPSPSPFPSPSPSPSPLPSPSLSPSPSPSPSASPSPSPSPSPAPSPSPSPSLSPAPSPSPSPAPAACATTLQALVDAAAPGATVSVPACVYRETVTVTKPLTLAAQPGAEIRGSEVWTGWTKAGAYWTRGGLPAFYAHGACQAGTARCLWPQQVFLDGTPLVQVASNPASGQFAVSGPTVSLADDPTGRTVEVTVRTGWIRGAAHDVTIQGFRMRHAANDAQTGALSNDGYSLWTIRDNALSDTHGAVVGLVRGGSHRLLGNDISRGGQLGVSVHEDGGGVSDSLIQGNRIHHNNTEGFSGGWEAGGLKAKTATRLTLDANEVYDNDGPGLWCDIDCKDIVFSNNRVHHNQGPGLFFEISDGARIFGNAVWENGWAYAIWGWGAGILISTAKNAELFANTVAWNGDGIAVIEQDRGPVWLTANVNVHDNTVAAVSSTQYDFFGLAWLSDYSTRMFETAAANRGANNAYFLTQPTGSTAQFSWRVHMSQITDFNLTPGEENGRLLTLTEKDQRLAAVGIPLAPSFR